MTSGFRSCDPELPIRFTPVTHRISKAKRGQRVHACDYPGCMKILTRAEHLRRHKETHDRQLPRQRRRAKEVKQSTPADGLIIKPSMDRQISSQNEPSPHTKRRHKPAIGKFSIPRGAYKMPPTAAFKPPAKSPGHLSAPMRNLPVRRQLTFDSEVDSEVPKVHNPGSLPSPVSDTTMSLPPSRSCSPDDSQSSMEDLPDGIKEALLTNPPLRNINSSLASKCVIM